MSQKRFVFVHIPKTGGQYFSRQVVNQNENFKSLGHSWLSSYNHWENLSASSSGMSTDTYTIEKGVEYVTIVRNPFALLHSMFYQGRHLKPIIVENGWGGSSYHYNVFSNFVDAYLDRDRWFFAQGFRDSLFQQVKDSDGKFVTNHILKFEDLENEIIKFCNDNGLNRLPPGPKVSRNKADYHWSEEYDFHQVRKLTKRWGSDLSRFGYKFGHQFTKNGL